MSTDPMIGSPTAESTHDEFLATACSVMMSSTGPDALDTLGWWELLSDLDEPVSRIAIFTAVRAHGHALSDAPMLGGILAQPFIADTVITPGSVVAAIGRQSRQRGAVHVLLGDPGKRQVLVDEPGRGAHILDPSTIAFRVVEVPGRITVREFDADVSGRRPEIDEDVAASARIAGTYLGRVATAAEMLGSAKRTVELAVTYACEREQFAQPIGTFQAVRHLLAQADADCVALDSVIRKALLLSDAPPPHWDEVVKATAGRNGRRVCESTLQVFGGIGFTAEHVHHHHHSRVLLLDTLLGSSAELTRGLGEWLRTTGEDPGYPATVLAGGIR